MSKDFYTDAHLWVAAVRVLTHLNQIPPSIPAASKMLRFSEEHGHMVCRRLVELGIIERVVGAQDDKLFVKNHLSLEDIPRDQATSKLDEELKRFQSARRPMAEKIESLKAHQDEKKKKLFAELEQQLKKRT